MKKIVIIFFSALMLLFNIELSAQIKGSDYAKIGKYIINNYSPDSIALSKFCRSGCIFMKFKVNSRGELASLSFSGDTDSTKFITDALTIAVNFVKQNASLIDFLKKSGRMIMQPFIYHYQVGCKFPEAGKKSSTDYYLSYIDIISDMDHVPKSLSDILKFRDGNMQFFDGVLLNPLTVSYSIMH